MIKEEYQIKMKQIAHLLFLINILLKEGITAHFI